MSLLTDWQSFVVWDFGGEILEWILEIFGHDFLMVMILGYLILRNGVLGLIFPNQ